MPAKPRQPHNGTQPSVETLRSELQAILAERAPYQTESAKLTAEAVDKSFAVNLAIAKDLLPEAEVIEADVLPGCILVPSDSGGNAEQQIAELKKRGIRITQIHVERTLRRVLLIHAPATGKPRAQG